MSCSARGHASRREILYVVQYLIRDFREFTIPFGELFQKPCRGAHVLRCDEASKRLPMRWREAVIRQS